MPKIHPTKGKLKREWITVMKIAKQTPIYFQVERSQGKNSNIASSRANLQEFQSEND